MIYFPCKNVGDPGIKSLEQIASEILQKGKTVLVEILNRLQEQIIRNLCGERHSRGMPFLRRGSKTRKLRPSLGDIKFEFRLIQPRDGGKRFAPLEAFLNIPRFKRIQKDTIFLGITQAPMLSYRKSAKNIKTMTQTSISKSTLWKEVQKLDIATQTPDLPIDIIYADDTLVKSARRKVKFEYFSLVIGRNNSTGKEFLLYAGVNESWEDIVREIKKKTGIRNVYAVCDSDREIKNAFRDAKAVQLCLVHAVDYVRYALWNQKAPKNFRKRCARKMEELFETLKNSVKKHIGDGDLERMKNRIEITRKALLELADRMEERGFSDAGGYVRRRMDDMLTFARAAMKNESVPATNNREEREMRECAYRAKRIGARWSDKGLLKLMSLKFMDRFDKGFMERFKGSFMEKVEVRNI